VHWDHLDWLIERPISIVGLGENAVDLVLTVPDAKGEPFNTQRPVTAVPTDMGIPGPCSNR
jgi:hypothetical protein